MTRALIFDCDGVLVDVEIQRHLRAFNQVWAELGIPWRWTEAEYARLLRVSGGKERLRLLRYTPSFRRVFDVPDDIDEWDRIVSAWHSRKTEIYVEMIITDGVRPRSGVRRLARDAVSAGWRVAVASSGARPSVEALVRTALGADLASAIVLVTGESVRRKKPSPEVFDLAAASVRIPPTDCVVVEDTRNGLLAAMAAGMPCVITPTSLSIDEDFSGAALVVSGLGDPDTPSETVLGGWAGAAVHDPYLSLPDLAELGAVSSRRSALSLTRSRG
jgi:HAD superfamily hydrolase (TIGR01509 family)